MTDHKHDDRPQADKTHETKEKDTGHGDKKPTSHTS